MVLFLLHPTRPRATGTQLQTFTAGNTAELRDWDATIDRMVDSRDLRSGRSADDTLLARRTHERLDQYYRGIRVFGGSVMRQAAAGLAVSIAAQLYSGIGLDPSPRLSEDDAKAVVAKLADFPGDDLVPDALTYRIRVKTATDRIVYFVNAMTGGIVRRYTDLERQSAIGKGTASSATRRRSAPPLLAGASLPKTCCGHQPSPHSICGAMFHARLDS